MAEKTTIQISDRELSSVAIYFRAPNAWGPTPEAMLAQGEIHDELKIVAITSRLTRAEKKTETGVQIDLGALSDKPKPYRLSPEAVEWLRKILARPAQPNGLAQIGLGALRRIKP
jgi:hypothetical protein